MTTQDLYHANLRPLIITSKIVGAEIWTSTKRYTPASFSIMIQIVIYFGCNIWTAVRFRQDIIQMMKIINCAGIALQLTIKFFIALSLKERLKKLSDHTETHLYVRYGSEKEPENQLVRTCAERLSIIWKVMAFLYCSTLFVFALYPLFIYITESKLIPLFMFEVPGIDWHTTQGYIITVAVQVCTYVMGLCGMILADYLFVYLVFHGMTMIDIFELHMEQLTAKLKSKSNEDEPEIEKSWKNCLKDHISFTKFFKDIEDMLALICLIQIFTGVFAICDNMVLMLLTDWYAAYLFLLVCFVQLTIYFLLGNALELKVDSLHACLTHFPWDLLTVTQQKEYCFVMCRMRKSFMITMYGFSPLNFESYMSILRLLYQFFMMIFNFVQ
ncbi:uncharacterized protein LOC135717140 [Ochlerotatus camptorhynchus]|uniref:uncharacterized protein LOC135717140 n=1 Tax=Ochlerotatus camptorhynchus TaxID=644619 RepID=UPI0031D83160